MILQFSADRAENTLFKIHLIKVMFDNNDNCFFFLILMLVTVRCCCCCCSYMCVFVCAMSLFSHLDVPFFLRIL